MASWAWLVAAVAALVCRAAFGLSPVQQQILAKAAEVAKAASAEAEVKLLSEFGSVLFRTRLASEGPGGASLAALTPEELLRRLKAALQSLEWTHNFGLDEASRRLNPGNPAMDPSTIDEFGHLPTDWELRAAKLPLVVNMSTNQWGVEDAAETGLYSLPEFADISSPTVAEVADRPQYLAGNLRRMELGVQRYGAYCMVVRGDVVRDRAVMIGSDSGGWQSGCNDSVKPVHPQNWFEKLIEKSVIKCNPVQTTPVGVQDNQLHTLLANTATFGLVGGNLPRVLFQLLDPGASARPLEVNMYTEAALFGPLTTDDVKLLAADFAGLFGTKQGQELKDFCVRRGLPLAWGLGTGMPWPEETAHTLSWIPLEGWELWPSGRSRLLDPQAGWPATNSSLRVNDADAVWDQVWQEVLASRADSTKQPNQSQFTAWWNRISAVSLPVTPLKQGECASADLCFGTYSPPKGSAPMDCACRKPFPSVRNQEVIV